MLMRRYREIFLIIFLALLLVAVPGCRSNPQGNNGKPPEVNGEPEGEEEGNGTGEEEEGNGTGEEDEYSLEVRVVVSGDNLALRKTPGTKNKESGDVLLRLQKGSKVYLQDHHENRVVADDFVWWEVYDDSSKTRGWSAAKFLLYDDIHRTGTLEGSITFPSSHIPPGFTVVAEEVDTGQEYKTNRVLTGGNYQYGVGFKLKVPYGNYHIYAVEPNAPSFKAYYDKYMQSDFAEDSYDKILVAVDEGTVINDILVGNWWRPGYP
jgi:hypothetical protein